jgi:crossover junction endodeoxyribonuclease RuvC
MIILGMDLSIACPGFCVAEIRGGQVEILHLSHVKTKTTNTHGERLRIIFDHLENIFNEFPNIEVVAREKAIPASKFPGHVQTIMVLNKVVGITDLLTDDHGYKEIHEIPPTTLKKSLTGSGAAGKPEVQAAVLPYLRTAVKFKNFDESDAAGVVVAYGKEKKLLG